MDNAKTSVKNFGSNTWTGFTARIDAIKNSASNALIPVKALFDENQVVRQTARREIAATLKPIFTEPATNTWNKFTQGIDSAKPKINDFNINTFYSFSQVIESTKLIFNYFTTNTLNKFTQGIDKAKTSISQITWAGFAQNPPKLFVI
ncbi:MAG: hypothetical protein ACKPGL_06220 [Dolichospermum sp.]